MRSRFKSVIGNSRIFSLIWRIRVGGILLAGFALWVFAQIADEVLEKESYAFDTGVLLAIRRIHTTLLDQAMMGITFIGDPSVLLVVSLGVGIWLLQQKRRASAATLALGAFGAIGLNVLLKHLFSRARPALWNRIVDVGQYSFPSGHAMISLVVYGTIGYLAARHFPRWRLLIILLTIFSEYDSKILV